jgi:hypothetical protein
MVDVSVGAQAVSVLDREVYIRPGIGRTMIFEMVVVLIHAQGETIDGREGQGSRECDR